MKRLAIVALLMPLVGCGSRPPDVRNPAVTELSNPSPSVTNRDGVAVVHGQAATRWGDVVDVLDRVKQSGTMRFVLDVSGERDHQSNELTFPRSEQLTDPLSVFELAEVEHLQHVTAKIVVLRAPAAARFGDVVDAVRTLQGQGASVLFAVARPPSERPASSSSPRLGAAGLGPCPFPADADAARIDDAVVVVDVEVSPTGRASSVHSVSDPGHGFGAAAETCALAASYVPARDSTGPVSGHVKLRVRFERPAP